MNLPNRLTVLRMIMVPFFIAAFMYEKYIAALIIFSAASLTDYFDGRIARERNLITNFGKIMDPLADKVLVYSCLCLLVENGLIRGWMLIVILAREFVVAGMRTVSASEGRVLAAGMSGKIKTVLQMVAVIVMLLGLSMGYLNSQGDNFSTSAAVMKAGYVIFWASLVMTVYSGCEYVYKNRDVFSM